MKYATLEEARAAFPRTTIASDGHTTSLWHRQHEFWVEHIKPLQVRACDHCGGDVLDGGQRHELCRARRAARQPTPRLNQTRECPCRPCVDERRALVGRALLESLPHGEVVVGTEEECA